MGFNLFMVKLVFKNKDLCDECHLNEGNLDDLEASFGYKFYLCNECILIKKASEIERNDILIKEYKRKLKHAYKILKLKS